MGERTASTIALSWSPPLGVFSGFELLGSLLSSQAADDPLTTFSSLLNMTSHNLYIVSNLEPHTHYRFALRTLSGSGENQTFSSFSNEVDSFTCKCQSVDIV